MVAPSVYRTPFVDIGVGTDIYTSGDALGTRQTVNVPKHGVIMGIVVVDRDSEEVNLDVVIYTDATAGTADNAAYAPTDAELDTCLGAVLVDTWKTFSTNSIGVVDNIGLPYWVPTGTLEFQCVTRGTPTYTAATDVRVSFLIVI